MDASANAANVAKTDVEESPNCNVDRPASSKRKRDIS